VNTSLTRAGAGVVLLAALAAPSAAVAAAPCSPSASLVSFSDALDKTTFGGQAVGGLSAIARLNGNQLVAQVDNQGSTPARFFTLKRAGNSVAVTKVTTLKKPDGTPFTGQSFDGEGIAVEPDGNLLISSETEPVIRRFDKNGNQLAQLNTPTQFGVAPNSRATTNLTFEGLTLTRDGKTLFAGMEGPLAGETGVRWIRYDKPRNGDFIPGDQFVYTPDSGLAVSEIQAVDAAHLLVLERGFTANVGNTLKVYEAYIVNGTVTKKLLFDIGQCPPMGAANPGPQVNPLLDNIEGMLLEGDELTLISDDNFSATEVTRVYRFQVKLHEEPVLESRALYSATQLQPAPSSGNSGVGQNNGITPPFNGQPIPGFSGALNLGGGRLLAMPDNGFGTKDNSRDFLLRAYTIRPDWSTHKIAVEGFISLRDPDRKIPFPLVRDDRLLTGGDFDIESIARDRKGDLWFGEEFGPYLLHTDATGKVLDAPFALAGANSPSSPISSPARRPRCRARAAGRPSRRARTAARCTRSSRATGPMKRTGCGAGSTSSTSRASATPAAAGRSRPRIRPTRSATHRRSTTTSC
jgi:hypothetical protein